jgi:hypothetical protein
MKTINLMNKRKNKTELIKEYEKLSGNSVQGKKIVDSRGHIVANFSMERIKNFIQICNETDDAPPLASFVDE